MSGPKQRSASTPATQVLIRMGIPFEIHSFDIDDHATAGGGSGYGLQAAKALGVTSSHVFKTLIAVVDARPCVGIVPVDCSLDLKAFAAACNGRKAVMAEPVVAERLTGYVIGGISPIGQRRSLPTVIDQSAQDLPKVFVSAGRRGLEVALSAMDLLRATSGTLAPIARRDE